ncbi:ATP-binding protein [Kitasatospora sp. NPDC097691]|uniref:ATP-binding protein n=1 Tax=Kitasatospora sp. NPDC097691 TaxID=3157231 RepID=UPI00332F6A0C
MARVVRHPPGKERPPNAPMSSLPIRRAWARVVEAFACRWHKSMIRWEARRGTPRPRKWRRLGSYTNVMRVFWGIAALLVLAWCAEGLYIVISGNSTGFETWRRGNSGFDALIRFVGPVLTAGIATAIFLFWWYRWTKKRFLAKARRKPNELVLTAGPHISEVVGRQELAQVIAQRLRERETRRPYLLVGGVGVGKTAVLVQLTEILAKQHAVPVPIRLRDAAHASDLNFEQMAKRRFSEEAPQGILARSKNDRVWHQLLADDKPVVIADGLEEAILDESLRDDRDNIIRRAIDRAYQERLPLVVASRPHAPLEGTSAAIIELEPLSEEAALRFVEARSPESDERRLDWIVETAEVTESPIYLQIARELHSHDALERDRPRHDDKRLNTRSWDRSTLRLWLLETWYHALVEGRLHDDVTVSLEERRDTMEVVSALACIGLLQDTLEVSFADLLGEDTHPGRTRRMESKTRQLWLEQRGFDQYGKRGTTFSEWQRELVWDELCARLSDGESRLLSEGSIGQCQTELARFVGHASELKLVEGFDTKVRFPHSIIQAYYGFRLLDHLSERQAGRLIEQALHPPGPSRELLIALVLLSRRRAAKLATEAGNSGTGVKAEAQEIVKREAKDLWRRAPLTGRTPAERLCRAASRHMDPKAFDLYAAALEIDSVEDTPRLLGRITLDLQQHWDGIKGDRRTLDEAKLGLVKQYGAALRTGAPKIDTTSLYERLFELGSGEQSYAIRLAAAQEVGSGGDPAFEVIRKKFGLNRDPLEEYQARTEELRARKRAEYGGWVAEMRKAAASRGPSRTASDENDPLNRKRQEIIDRYRRARRELGRQFVMRAWMIPMLLGSVSDGHRDEARNRLEKWLRHLDPERSDLLPLSLENALAQGFKYAANRRKRHPDTYPGGRDDLIRQAETVLQQARCWYSQICLLQALCLWELPDSIARSEPDGGAAAAHSDGGKSSNGSNGSNGRNGSNGGNGRNGGKDGNGAAERPESGSGMTAVQTVGRWLSMAGSAWDGESGGAPPPRLHPFVAEAGDLVALALQTREPDRFVWIDEKGVVDNIGSRSNGSQHYRKHNLWIPPSVGWTNLDGRTQRLIADVLVMLNLIERDGFPDEVEDRLKRSHQPGMTLPPCVTRDRAPLHPELTAGTSDPPAPGTTCLPTCKFQFCPYPPQGTQLRAEIGEPFCRQQQALLPGRVRRRLPRVFRRKTPSWVGMPVLELHRFWDDMAERTRG